MRGLFTKEKTGVTAFLVCVVTGFVAILLASSVAAQALEKNARNRAARGVSILQFGAVAGGRVLNTRAIQSGIDQLAAEGGGTLIFPNGVFLSGAIFLKPGVNLHLEAGAVLKCSTDMRNFPEQRTRIEGHFEDHFNPALLNADGCDGLRITGEGTLDGSGRPIWDRFWELRNASPDPKNFKNLSVPRARLCFIENSKHVLIDGLTFKDSQFWNLHLYKCRKVRVHNSRFQVPDEYKRAPSTDGIDVDSSQNVSIKGCFFSVTDDCIALKGSKGPDALRNRDSPPVQHVRIVDCTFKRGGGVTLGSEATIIRDVVVENCRFTGPMPVLNLKLRPDTPQRYEDIYCRSITVNGEGGKLLSINPWTQYFDLKGQPPPISWVHNVTLENVTGRYGAFGSIQGNPGQTQISAITLRNIRVELERPILKAGNVKELRFQNVFVNGKLYSVK